MECEDHAAYFGGMLVLHLVEVITQGFGAGDVLVDAAFRLACDGGGFGGKGLGLRGRSSVLENLRWRNLRHLKFTVTLRPDFNRQRIPDPLKLLAGGWVHGLPNHLAALGVAGRA